MESQSNRGYIYRLNAKIKIKCEIKNRDSELDVSINEKGEYSTFSRRKIDSEKSKKMITNKLNVYKNHFELSKN